MSTVSSMLATYPGPLGDIDSAKLIRCIEVCIECAQACTACADSDLSEERLAHLTTCIRTNLDCADICVTTSRVLSRYTAYDATVTQAVLEACAVTCKACGDECDLHSAHHEHCRICADV
ncbi:MULTISPECIES: four-helix bundle copper-binding protein [Mycobacterium]|uniref:four-helix bundle copper-binding protein n=1 Tax=Mycobacterium TaxID=1763 RepID=UPI0007FF2BB3|nr:MULTISPECIES: four-helix bundle copper-binding protein [Mycobacterium]OBG62623.1 four-helix bundle copper-binding protein [Mycobacterium sp. E188]OBH35970.1 four-helix bundle copper-binding protein [Mycobacterium sp. E183]OBH81523.1 four-helix bundle copper-binding protein [Mycobacterium scrofulaceum]